MNAQHHSELVEAVHNQYKCLHGIRPRHIDFASMTCDELRDMIEELLIESQHQKRLAREEQRMAAMYAD